MDVVPGQAPGGSTDHAGKTYWFCSQGCREKFVGDPTRYVAPSPTKPAVDAIAPAPAPSRAKWTCPMHPQIVRDEPGSCPICGMALEPMTVTADEGPAPELIGMTRRFWIGLALTAPLLVFMIGDMLPGQPLRHPLTARSGAADGASRPWERWRRGRRTGGDPGGRPPSCPPRRESGCGRGCRRGRERRRRVDGDR